MLIRWNLLLNIPLLTLVINIAPFNLKQIIILNLFKMQKLILQVKLTNDKASIIRIKRPRVRPVHKPLFTN